MGTRAWQHTKDAKNTQCAMQTRDNSYKHMLRLHINLTQLLAPVHHNAAASTRVYMPGKTHGQASMSTLRSRGKHHKPSQAAIQPKSSPTSASPPQGAMRGSWIRCSAALLALTQKLPAQPHHPCPHCPTLRATTPAAAASLLGRPPRLRADPARHPRQTPLCKVQGGLAEALCWVSYNWDT